MDRYEFMWKLKSLLNELPMQEREEALKYYQDILKEEKPQMQDYLNFGHVWLVMGRTSEALKHYNQAQESFKNHDEFLNLFEKDMELLTRRGIAKEDIYILLDLLVKA